MSVCKCHVYSFPHRPLSGECTAESLLTWLYYLLSTQETYCVECPWWKPAGDHYANECTVNNPLDCPAVRGFLEKR